MAGSEAYPVSKGGSSSGVSIIVIAAAAIAAIVAIVALALGAVIFVKVNQSTTSGPGGLITPPAISTNAPPPKRTTSLPPANNSAGYVQAANIFANSINTSINPCQDFYQFACGQWMTKNPIPKDSSSQISFNIINAQILKTLSQIFSSATNPSWANSIKMSQTAWKTCVGFSASNNSEQQIWGRINAAGGWPMVNQSWQPSSAALDTSTMLGALVSMYGVSTFISPYVDTDWRNPTRQMLVLDQASLTLPTIYYTTSAVWQNYRPILMRLINMTSVQLAQASGAKYNATRLASDIADIITLESTLANYSVPAAKLRNYSQQYNIYTPAQAQATYTNINFTNYLSSLRASSGHGIGHFMVLEPSYLKQLNNYLATLHPRIIQNYFAWRFAFQMMPFIPSTSIIRDFYRTFKQGVDHVDDVTPQQTACTSQIISYLPYPTGRLYVDNHFNTIPRARSALASMITSVLGSFRSMLSNLNWMGAPTKQQAVMKVNSILQNVAYPDWIMKNSLLDNYVIANGRLAINPKENWFQTTVRLSTYSWQQQLNQLNNPTNRRNFLGSPAIVNAWYQPELNSITFPAGILNPPFFNPAFPSSVNYGGMGVVMGHELTHGFDDEGVQWTGNGTLYNWMDSKSNIGFKKMAQCVQNEYGSFCYPPSANLSPNCIQGVRTQGENIADNGGIKAAFLAYKNSQILTGVQPRLPGAMQKFTHDQLFFMSFAQVWCRNVKHSALQTQLLIDPHSPAKYRVYGTIRNFPAFAKAFNCPANSPMLNQPNCNVW